MSEDNKSNIGRVLWFDQKKGYGYVHIVNPESEYYQKDIFVHFSSITCESSFKKLYPGEYVSLDIIVNLEENDEKKKIVSSNITGVHGGPLLIDNTEYRYKLLHVGERS
jgi:cold shock CspA family protein